MKERFQTILNLEKISAAQLAAILGIQRSTLSNILGGRNNPSYEVIHGLLTKLPNLNIDWLLTGEGQPYRNLQKNFRGEKISEKTEEDKYSGNDVDFSGTGKSDLFGFEKQDEDFPLDTDAQKTAQNVQQQNTQQPITTQTIYNQNNNLSGPSNNDYFKREESQKKEKEKEEVQTKIKRLQQIVNEKAAAAKRALQPSENQINGSAPSSSGQIKELKKVILLYTDNSFEEYGKI